MNETLRVVSECTYNFAVSYTFCGSIRSQSFIYDVHREEEGIAKYGANLQMIVDGF